MKNLLLNFFIVLCFPVSFYGQEASDYRQDAEQGDAEAQFYMAGCYMNGDGVTKDYAEAIKWFRKAAEQGHTGAETMLGTFYFNGEGVTKDYVEAVKWLKKAAGKGEDMAQFYLGSCYYNGGYGIAKNYAEAIRWFRESADRNNLKAQSMLGTCYLTGIGVEQDYNTALYWIEKAFTQKEKLSSGEISMFERIIKEMKDAGYSSSRAKRQ
jgi:TPR repeat protein